MSLHAIEGQLLLELRLKHRFILYHARHWSRPSRNAATQMPFLFRRIPRRPHSQPLIEYAIRQQPLIIYIYSAAHGIRLAAGHYAMTAFRASGKIDNFARG